MTSPDSTDESNRQPEELLISFDSLGDADWDFSRLELPRRFDMRGEDRRVVETLLASAHHKQDPLGFVKQYVFHYDTELSAQTRFDEQAEWIFDQQFGVPVEQQASSYGELSLPLALLAEARKSRSGCVQFVLSRHCSVLIQWRNLTIYIEAYTHRSGYQFVSDGQLESLLLELATQLSATEG